MTTEDAFQLFADYGNVSKDIRELKLSKPTRLNLYEATSRMILDGVAPEQARAARLLVENFFQMENMDP